MEKLKVIIADDHPIVLFGVRELVERDPHFCVVGEAVSSSALIALLQEQPVDLVITDYNMPDDSPYGDGEVDRLSQTALPRSSSVDIDDDIQLDDS